MSDKSDNLSLSEILDGLALFQEHAPASAEDWIAVARRFNADNGDRSESSPLFAALSLAIEQLDGPAKDKYAYRVCVDLGRDGIGRNEVMSLKKAQIWAEKLGPEGTWIERSLLGEWEVYDAG